MNPPTRNVSLRNKTSFRIGGQALYYSAAGHADHVVTLLAWAADRGVPVLVLGNGSNMLVSDKGWPGLVIDLGQSFRTIAWDETCAVCDSGASMSALVEQSLDRGLSGLEKLAGIPGTVGGALVMNAGAFGQEISASVEHVDIVNIADRTRRRLARSEIEFGYRTSSLKRADVIIVGARLHLERGDADRLRGAAQEVLGKRREKQPLDKPNCGSVFKRPPGAFAGTLIEQCGLKGLRVGDAMVSPKHANFIVNMGAAGAEDVRALIAQVQRRVYEQTRVLLEPEVIFAGEFETPLYEPG